MRNKTYLYEDEISTDIASFQNKYIRINKGIEIKLLIKLFIDTALNYDPEMKQ